MLLWFRGKKEKKTVLCANKGQREGSVYEREQDVRKGTLWRFDVRPAQKNRAVQCMDGQLIIQFLTEMMFEAQLDVYHLTELQLLELVTQNVFTTVRQCATLFIAVSLNSESLWPSISVIHVTLFCKLVSETHGLLLYAQLEKPFSKTMFSQLLNNQSRYWMF